MSTGTVTFSLDTLDFGQHFFSFHLWIQWRCHVSSVEEAGSFEIFREKILQSEAELETGILRADFFQSNFLGELRLCQALIRINYYDKGGKMIYS